MSSDVLKAFDNCPNRTTTLRGGGNKAVVCIRYPGGYDVAHSATFKNEGDVIRERVAREMGCVACPDRNTVAKSEELKDPFEGFHPSIVEHCKPKFNDAHYGDAVLTGALIVRDRLRDLTGYEAAAEAFGRGGLIVAGSANAHTEANFQAGARFLMMANDRFRNELAHTNDRNALISDPNLALQFLGMSSLSAFLLDGARVVPQD